MVGVVVVSKFITHENEDNFSGMVDYMDRSEAIKNNNISLQIQGVELDNVEKKLLSVINKTGSTDIDVLVKDEKLKNMICFEQKLFEKKNSLTRYDSNYIFKRYFNKDSREFSIENIDKVFNKTHKNKNSADIEKEKKRVITRLNKLEKLDYVVKQENSIYKITPKAESEIKKFSDFEFTSYDVNKIFTLVRDTKYLKSIEGKLIN